MGGSGLHVVRGWWAGMEAEDCSQFCSAYAAKMGSKIMLDWSYWGWPTRQSGEFAA